MTEKCGGVWRNKIVNAYISLFFTLLRMSSFLCKVQGIRSPFLWWLCGNPTLELSAGTQALSGRLNKTHKFSYYSSIILCLYVKQRWCKIWKNNFPIYAMQVLRRGTASQILNLDPRWKWVVGLTPWPIYPCIRGKSFVSAGIRTTHHLAHNLASYCLRYPGSARNCTKNDM